MTKLPQVSGRDCVKALQKVGFTVDRQRGSHVIMLRETPRGRVSVPNHKNLKPGTLRTIIREAGLTVEEFVALL
jgi:predicted RNA binding protein YcfA (HicA-like mRNA interferase family)